MSSKKVIQEKKQEKNYLVIDDNYIFEVISNLRNKINYANNKLMKEIYNNYFSNLSDNKITFEEFKNNIHKNKKSDINPKITDEELKKLFSNSDSSDISSDDEENDDNDNSDELINTFNKCKFMVYNKGNIRHCLRNKLDNKDFCKFHDN